MATDRQKAAAKTNVRKAAAAAERSRSIARALGHH
jgi:hypothetical protein